MKIRLVAPPYSNAPELVPPLGLMSIASFLKHTQGDDSGLDIAVFDCAGVDADNYDLLDQFIQEGVQLIGFPIYSEYVTIAAQWAAYLRERAPEMILVAGGPHVSLTWKHFTQRWGHLFHYTISGDGEVPFSKLVECLRNGTSASEIVGVSYLSSSSEIAGSVVPSPQLPATAWPNPFDAKLSTMAKARPVFIDPFDAHRRTAVTLVNSRSCPMRCSFCSIITVSQKWIAAEVASVISWLLFEYDRAPYEHIYFLDANFFVKSDRVCQIATLIKENLPNVTWSALSTVLMFLKMKSSLPMLIDSGLRMVELGIESGSQRQLDIMQKDCKVEKNYEAVQLLQAHGLRIGLDYIMFYPEQTIDDLKDNLLFLLHSGLVCQLDDLDHYFNALLLYPGTPLRHKYAKMFGLEFDPDCVPQPDNIFLDDGIREIFRLTKQFRDRHMPWIKEGLNLLRMQLAGKDPDLNFQKVRLDFISLKHLPLKVMWHLLDYHDYSTIEEAIPELLAIKRSFEAIHANQAEPELV